MSVELTWVDPDDLDAWRGALRDNTKALFGETIGNPSGNVLDIEGLAGIAHDTAPADRRQHVRHAVSVPPDRVGRGHRRPLGDEVHRWTWDQHRRNRRRGRHLRLVERPLPGCRGPSPAYHGLKFHETFGTYGYLMKLRAETLRDLGAALSPFNAFLFLQGLETLSLRMERHVENASAVADLPESHDRGLERDLPRACRTAATGRWWRSTCRAAPARCSRSTAPAAGRGPGADPRRDALVAPGERRRREEPDHPSRQHDAPPAERRGAAQLPASRRHDPALGRRIGRGPQIGSGRRSIA